MGRNDAGGCKSGDVEDATGRLALKSVLKKRGGLSIGRLVIRAPVVANGVTFVRHSIHSISKDVCVQMHKAEL